MGYVSVEMDAVQSLANWYRQNIRYTPHGVGQGAEETKTVTGFSHGSPYGDLYRVNDVFLTEGDAQKAGEVYYVAESKPGSPTLRLQKDHPLTHQVAPYVVHTDSYATTQEKRSDANRAFIGIRSRGNSRYGVMPGTYVDRLMHTSGDHFIIARPFWEGTFYIQVDSSNSWDTKNVMAAINSGLDIESSLYRLALRLRPVRTDLNNILIQGRWTESIQMNITATATINTPIHDLPPGTPQIAWRWNNITGVTPIVEESETGYYETAGDYQVGGGPYHNPLPPFPEEE